MPAPPHADDAIEAGNRRGALPQLQSGRHRPVQLLKPIEEALAVVLEGEASQLNGLLLQGLDRPAVIKAEGKIIAPTRGSEIKRQLEIELEPLSALPLEGQDPHMGPEPQLPHQDAVAGNHRSAFGHGAHKGRDRCRNWR